MRIYSGLAADERRAERRERLLESGLQLLGTGGWQAATVGAVCKHARLTPRYFYESFRDRDELLVAIFDGIIEEVTLEIQATLSTGPRNVREAVRANVAAWVKVTAGDRRKGRVAFVEALGGSDALMRRRLDTARRFADVLSMRLRAVHGIAEDDRRALDVASLIVAGGLIETMIEWLNGRLDCSANELVEDFTTLCATTLEAAVNG
jgi:AcrR family transcriptional regulator